MRDRETFEARLAAAYRRYADEVDDRVDPMALARASAPRTRCLSPTDTPNEVPDDERNTQDRGRRRARPGRRDRGRAAPAIHQQRGLGPLPVGEPDPDPRPAPGRPAAGGDLCRDAVRGSRQRRLLPPPQAGCSEAIPDDDIRVTLTVPDGWSGVGDLGVGLDVDRSQHAHWAEVIFVRGAWLLHRSLSERRRPRTSRSDRPPRTSPTRSRRTRCSTSRRPSTSRSRGTPGSTSSCRSPWTSPTCDAYRPWEPGYFARWPGERWHLWILDVGGLRVIVRAMVHEGTTPEVMAQLQGIVDSIAIEPATALRCVAIAGSLAWSPASLEQDWPAPVRAEPVGDPVIVPLAGGLHRSVRGHRVARRAMDRHPERDSRLWRDASGSTSPRAPDRRSRVRTSPGSPTGWSSTRTSTASPTSGSGWTASPRNSRRGEASRCRLDVRAWRTDLRTGTTESGDVGFLGLRLPSTPVSGRDYRAHLSSRQAIPGRFYAWASVIQDGRVVATDYAPDSGWLDSTGSIPADTPAASPSQ